MQKDTATATALIFHDGKLLMLLRDDIPTIPSPDTWSLIGGTMEDGETPLETLKREVQEEIGVVPSNITYIGKPDRERYRYFAHMTDEERLKVKLGNEGQKLEFFEIDELKNIKTNPRMKKWIDNHSDKIKYLANTPDADVSSVKDLLD
jgi:8-oxo-dGTP diphosphatase